MTAADVLQSRLQATCGARREKLEANGYGESDEVKGDSMQTNANTTDTVLF